MSNLNNKNLPNAFTEGLVKIEFGPEIAKSFPNLTEKLYYNRNPVKHTWKTNDNDNRVFPLVFNIYNKEITGTEIRYTIIDKKISVTLLVEDCRRGGFWAFVRKTLLPSLEEAMKEGKFDNIDYDAMLCEAMKNPSYFLFQSIYSFYYSNKQMRQAFIWLKKVCYYNNQNDINEYKRWLRRKKGFINFSGIFLSKKIEGSFSSTAFGPKKNERNIMNGKKF